MEPLPDSPPQPESRTKATPPPSAKPPILPVAIPPVVPVLSYALSYYRRPPVQWIDVANCGSAGQWHALKAALMASHVESLMKDDTTAAPGQEDAGDCGYQLLVKNEDVPMARAIINAHRQGKLWCRYCGSTCVQKIPAPLYWTILELITLGLIPLNRLSKRCERCNRMW